MTKPKATTKTEHLILGHISDIHFRKKAPDSDIYVSDDDLRSELVNDIGQFKSKFGNFHGILITGDIAFAGDKDEYARARSWVRDLCKKTDCPEELVWTISGNHDVIRSVINRSAILQEIQKAIRAAGAAEKFEAIDAKILNYFADSAAPDLLFNSIQEYNNFAKISQCGFNSKRPFWEQNVLLNDGSTLRIRGLNSALVSNKDDDRGANKLVLGPMFSCLPREDGVEYMVLCHHPPQWLWDEDKINDYLNSRARLVLFGHKHVQRIKEEITGGHQVLRIHAGALNPDAGEAQYLPRYNCLRIRVVKPGTDRALEVEVIQRVWDAEKTSFSDGACQKHELKLPPWSPPASDPESLEPATAAKAEPLITLSDPLNVLTQDPVKARMLSAPRKLAYRFLDLPYHVQIEIAQALNLLKDEDEGQSEDELFRRFFHRAADEGRLGELWREVEKKYTDGEPENNPFKKMQ